MSLVKNINNSRDNYNKSKSPQFSTVIEQHPLYDSNQMSWLDALVTALDNKSSHQGLNQQRSTDNNYEISTKFTSNKYNQSRFKKMRKDQEQRYSVGQYVNRNDYMSEKENKTSMTKEKYNATYKERSKQQQYYNNRKMDEPKICIRRNSAPVSDNKLNESIGKIKKNTSDIKKDSFQTQSYCKSNKTNYLDQIQEYCRDIKSSLTKNLSNLQKSSPYPTDLASKYSSSNHHSIHQLRINKAEAAKHQYFRKMLATNNNWDKYQKILPKNIIVEQQVQSSSENYSKLHNFYFELFKIMDKKNCGKLSKSNCNTNELSEQLKYIFGSIINVIKNKENEINFDQFTKQCSRVTKNLDETQLKSLLEKNPKKPLYLETKRSFQSSQTHKEKKSGFNDSQVVRKFQFDFEVPHQPLRKTPYIQQPSIINTPPKIKKCKEQSPIFNHKSKNKENNNLTKILSKSPYMLNEQMKLDTSPQLRKTHYQSKNKVTSDENDKNKNKIQEDQGEHNKKKQRSLNALNQRLDKYINTLQRDYIVRMQDKLNFRELMKNLPKK